MKKDSREKKAASTSPSMQDAAADAVLLRMCRGAGRRQNVETITSEAASRPPEVWNLTSNRELIWEDVHDKTRLVVNTVRR